MTRLSLAIISLLIGAQCFALKFYGHFHKSFQPTVTLYFIENGINEILNKKHFITLTVDDKGNFYADIPLPHVTTINMKNENEWLFYNIYFHPNDSLHFDFYNDSMVINGRGEQHISYSMQLSDAYGTFFKNEAQLSNAMLYANAFDTFLAQQNKVMDEVLKGDAFETEMKEEIKEDVYYYLAANLLKYSWRNRAQRNNTIADKTYLNKIEAIHFDNPKATNSISYINFLREFAYSKWNMGLDHQKDSIANLLYAKRQYAIRDSIAQHYLKGETYELALAQIINDQLSFYQRAKGRPNLENQLKEMDKTIDTFYTKIKTPEIASAIKSQWDEIKKSPAPAPNFTVYDLNNKPVKLSDFKGKVVYVDVWATTCAPCVAEIPLMNLLQKKYEGKDIVFLQVSFDDDKPLVEKFVKAKDYHGYHTIAKGGHASEIARLYNISGIPRCMIIDKEGLLLSADAPRPSGNPHDILNGLLGIE